MVGGYVGRIAPGCNDMSDVPKGLEVDEDVWALYKFWSVLDITFLVLNIDPEKLEDGFEWKPTPEQITIQKKVSRILHEHRIRLGGKDGLKPIEAVNRLERSRHPLPEALVKAVFDAQNELKPEDKGPTKSGATRKYNKLLSMYLYVVCAKYGWVPKVGAPSVTKLIINDTEKRGGIIDDQTILARLTEGVARLGDAEKEALAKVSGIRKSEIEEFLANTKLANSPAK